MRILLIEDDRQTSAYVTKGLTEEGHIVDALADGREGLVQATSEPYDLVIVDRMLPGLDGLGLVKTLRATGSKVPILILTSLGGVDDRVDGLEAGADDYVVKPLSLIHI